MVTSPPPAQFLSFTYLCKDRVSQFCFYFTIITSKILYLRGCIVCLRGAFCFVKREQARFN